MLQKASVESHRSSASQADRLDGKEILIIQRLLRNARNKRNNYKLDRRIKTMMLFLSQPTDAA